MLQNEIPPYPHYEDITHLFESAPITVRYAPDKGRYPKIFNYFIFSKCYGKLMMFRYMVASRSISSGETILENEVPYHYNIKKLLRSAKLYLMM